MKRLVGLIILIIFTSCSVVDTTTDENNESYSHDFYITANTYAYYEDWDEAVQNEFGSDYKVADWTDFESYYANGGDILSVLDDLGLTDYENSAFVTLNGDPTYSDTRSYFLSRHEHVKPSYYLAHDNIDNYLVSLGSWDSTKKIIVIKK